MSTMRLSPVWLAAIAASATLGFSDPARGEIALSTQPSSDTNAFETDRSDASVEDVVPSSVAPSSTVTAALATATPISAPSSVPAVPANSVAVRTIRIAESVSPPELSASPAQVFSHSVSASAEPNTETNPSNFTNEVVPAAQTAAINHQVNEAAESDSHFRSWEIAGESTPSSQSTAVDKAAESRVAATIEVPLVPADRSQAVFSANAVPPVLSPSTISPTFLAQDTPTENGEGDNSTEETLDLDPAEEPDVPADTDFDLFPGDFAPSEPDPAPEATDSEARVLISEVVISAVEGQLDPSLEDEAYNAIETQPGRTTTQSQLQEDINAIFATGFFSNVQVFADDTPLGVRVTFVVRANPVLTSVSVTNNEVLPQGVIDETFSEQYGEILNLRRLQGGIEQLNQWYQDNGYVLAQVVDAPQISEDGAVTLDVAEGTVNSINVRFYNEEEEDIKGRTRDFIITREMRLKPGAVFNRDTIQEDLQRVFRLGLFEDVRLSLDPSPDDPRKVDVTVNVDERSSGSISAGAGFSSASGLFGTVSYQERNLGGNNQRLGAEVSVGTRELLFDVNFTDPWIGGDPYRTSYTVNAFRRRSISLVFDGGDTEVELPNGDRPRVLRLGGGVNFTRPLSRDPLSDAEWTASLGLRYQNVSIRDVDGDLSPEDELGNDLSFSGTGRDDLTTVQFGIVRDRRNNRLQATEGSFLRLATEQSIPFGSGNIFMNRLRASYSHYIPVSFTSFYKEGPQALAFNVQAGSIVGDLPPYEAFPLGGTSTVRGYDDGELGSGRHFVLATVEYRFPIASFLNGVLFVDAATDLGSGSSVPGDPAGIRDKPGSGFGYGVGVRVNSPLGPIRVDLGFSDQGDSRIHFGIGERF